MFNIPLLMQEMIAESKLQPIVEIRRDPDLTSSLHSQLCDLVKQTTLDKGTPPILVLSYKNHAIDEFLLDLVHTERGLHGSMIRIGGGASSDPRLLPYSERTFQRGDAQRIQCRREVDRLHKLASACKSLSNALGLFASFQVDMLEEPSGHELTAQEAQQSSL